MAPKSEDGRACSAWIPSKVGQAISIVWKDTDRSRATSADVLVDGTNCGGYILDTSRKWDEVCREYVRTSATEKRRLQFGALQLTDDDTYLTKDRRNVGEISVALWRCRVTRKGQTPMGGRRIESSLVHEKVKKGLAHTVTLGDAIKVAPSTGKRSERLDDEPLATFLFRYRGIDVLRANGIVAMSKLLTSSSSESAASATDAEVGQKRKASEELVSGREVKPEIVDIEHLVQVEKRDRQAEEEFRRARLEMLREQGRKNIKIEDVSTIISGEVIDLTDD